MNWKKTLLGGFAGGEEEEPSSQVVPGEEGVVTRSSQQRSVVPAVNPLTALRNGPTATIFTRTTAGLQPTAAFASSQIAPPAVDKEFDTVIVEALEQDSKEPGFREFAAQFKALSSIIPDKGQCTAAALAAVSAANPKLNATQVAKAIGERLRLLSSYESSYEADSRKSEQTEASDKQTSVSDSQSRIRELEAEIARLTGERAQLESQVGQLESELSGVTQKYDGYRARFGGTIQSRRNELKNILKFVAPGAQEMEEQ